MKKEINKTGIEKTVGKKNKEIESWFFVKVL